MPVSHDYKPFAELSPSSKAAVSDLLGYMLMQRKVGSDEAAGYYSFISQSMDVSGFFRACSTQFGKAWRKQRTADMLGLAKNQNPAVVIDAGCGTGGLLNELSLRKKIKYRFSRSVFSRFSINFCV